MLRKFLVLILTITMLLVGAAAVMAEPVGVIIEGFNDDYAHYLNLNAPAVIENGRTLVPLRPVAEALGFRVEWQPSNQIIVMKNDSQKIEMQIGSGRALVNGVVTTMDAAPKITGNTTMVPLRFLTQSLGYSVAFSRYWHEDQTDVYITPYTLISDEELQKINTANFDEVPCQETGPGSSTYFCLKKNGVTPSGLRLGASIKEVLQTYGIPHDPDRSFKYSPNWSGKLYYWGTFIPQSDAGTWVEFDLLNGSLVNMTVYY